MKTPVVNSNSNCSTLDVLQPAALQALFTHAPDRELFLTVELVFHHFVRPAELKQLHRSQVLVDRGNEPAALTLRGSHARHLVLAPARRALLNILIPASGPLFSKVDPFARLQRVAVSLGIRLSRRTAINSVVWYARAAGMPAAQVAHQFGYRQQNYHDHLFNPVLPRASQQYWRATVSLAHARALPRYRKFLTRTF
jgi:hypothetical protein